MLSEPFFTERLELRDITINDAENIFNLWNNPENDKYMSDPIQSVDEVVEICKNKATDSGFLKAVVLKESGIMIGTCCFGQTKSKDEWGFGYSLAKPYWGKGYATEIVKSIIDYGREKGIHNFVSECAEENVASKRVLEKCGMHQTSKSKFLQPTLNIEYVSLIFRLIEDIR